MSPCPHIDVHSQLAEALRPSVRICEATLEAYREEAESSSDSFFAAVVLALPASSARWSRATATRRTTPRS
jgi:hypothetical protein